MRELFARQFLDDSSLVAARVEMEEEHGTFTLSDGQQAITLDFVYTTPAERLAAIEKLSRLQQLVRRCSTWLCSD